MNMISSCSIACTAALIYKYKKSLQGAVIGLVNGAILTSVAMVLWNYLITPIYLGIPRAVVTPLLMTFFLPFNLIKGGINAAITMALYKPVSQVLRVIMRVEREGSAAKNSAAVVAVSIAVILLCAGAVYFIF